MAHKLAVRYLKRRGAAATGSPSVSKQEQPQRAPTPPRMEDSPEQSVGRQGICPMCGRSARLLRTQLLDARGGRVDWICSRCRG